MALSLKQPAHSLDYLCQSSALFTEFTGALQNEADLHRTQILTSLAIASRSAGGRGPLESFTHAPLGHALWYGNLGHERMYQPASTGVESVRLEQEAQHTAHNIVQSGMLQRTSRTPEGPLIKKALARDAIFTPARLAFECGEPNDTDVYLAMQAAHLGSVIFYAVNEVLDAQRLVVG